MELRLKLMFWLLVVTSVYIGMFLGSLKFIEFFFAESVLLEQPFVKDTDKTVHDVLRDNIAKLGENISIARFARFVLGDSA